MVLNEENAEEIIQRFESFFSRMYEKELLKLASSDEKSLFVNFADLDKFDIELADLVISFPDEMIKYGEAAISRLELGDEFLDVHLRFYNTPTSIKKRIADLRAQDVNHLICLEGIIRQASEVRPLIIEATYECTNCGNVIIVPQQNTMELKKPKKCICGKKGPFTQAETKKTDFQRIELEESPELLVGGEQPARITVYLKDDLVDPSMTRKVTPGAYVIVTGILKDVPVRTAHGKKTRTLDFIFEANNIEPALTDPDEIEITEEDEKKIKELAKDPDIYTKLRDSIAPSIYGHEVIKSAIVLSLFGGVRKKRKDSTETRGDIHILLLGDPGAGKSMLLKFINDLAPKSRYIAGKGTSAAGLTAIVTKDDILKRWTLEAGLLVLANKGFALVDEFDKMSSHDRSAMHEAMEQQTVTVSKANIQASLRAQTTVIAAANPKDGRFDAYKSIPSQVNLPAPLLNRFDLIFAIQDIPEKKKDGELAEKILRTHQHPEEADAPVDVELFRKYIAYARKHCKPVLTDSAVKLLRNFFVSIRNQYSSEIGSANESKPVPITARQLESLIRLTEASAKIRLSEKATEKDANRAILLMKEWLLKFSTDEEGNIDIDVITSGISSKGRRIKDIILTYLETKKQESLKTDSSVKAVSEEEIIEHVFDTIKITDENQKPIIEREIREILEKLNQKGDIYMPKDGYYSPI